jgi:branched-chain amino acid transport system ATP-binding protein
MSLLEVTALEAGYDDALILRGVTLHAEADEIVAVIGPNGAGKSTLLKAVYGLVTHKGGTVSFDGTDVTGMRADRLTRRGLNFVPQTDNVFPSLTVADNVQMGSLGLPKGERKEAVASVHALLPILGDRSRQRAGTLSGGPRKLVAIARALVTRPKLLLLDEPSAGLDLTGRETLLRTLGTLASDPYAPASVLVTHHVEEIPVGVTHVLLLKHGRVVESGDVV